MVSGFQMASGLSEQDTVTSAVWPAGMKAVVNPVSPNDYHATLLHLFGLDHNRLVYYHNGQEQLLTDKKPARVIKDILA